MKERRRNLWHRTAIITGIVAAILIIVSAVSLYLFDGIIDAQIAKVRFVNL